MTRRTSPQVTSPREQCLQSKVQGGGPVSRVHVAQQAALSPLGRPPENDSRGGEQQVDEALSKQEGRLSTTFFSPARLRSTKIHSAHSP